MVVNFIVFYWLYLSLIVILKKSSHVSVFVDFVLYFPFYRYNPIKVSSSVAISKIRLHISRCWHRYEKFTYEAKGCHKLFYPK